jgi:sugar porter (SP) family MFS transporter
MIKSSKQRHHETADGFNATYVWMISAVAALGGLLFGYDWVVIGGAKPFYETYFRLTSGSAIGWANSCALLGCLAGSIVSGIFSDRHGRKKLLILSAVLFAVSSIFTGWSYTFHSFVFWRIAGGIAIGIASNVSPTYIAEISPARWRGRLVTLNQMTIVIGILLAQVINWLIAQRIPDRASAEMIRHSWNGQYGWRWMFTAVAVPATVFFASAFFVPESPRWLMLRGSRRRAYEILARIGGAPYADLALEEMEAAESADPAKPAGLPVLFTSNGVKLLLVGVTLAVLQQWSGINVIFNYAEEIYRNAGYGVNDILFNIVITGTINLVFTLVALGFVDKAGRRPLLLLGCAGVGLSHLLIGIAYRFGFTGTPVLVLTLAAISCYAMSLAPVTWVVISEIFPNYVRGTAVSISVSALWIASFALTFTFPLINRAVGPSGAFWLYALICFAGFFFVLRYVPETKGKTLEEIEERFARTAV